MAKPKRTVKSKKKLSSPTKARSKARSKPRAAKAEARHHSWTSVEREQLNPSLQRQMVVGQDVMVARMLLKKGCTVPLHHHHNEQVSCILEGALMFVVDGKGIMVRGGEVLTIPPHVPHSAVAVEDTLALDVFNPPRRDWLDKTDQYLRGK